MAPHHTSNPNFSRLSAPHIPISFHGDSHFLHSGYNWPSCCFSAIMSMSHLKAFAPLVLLCGMFFFVHLSREYFFFSFRF